jgi:GH24 family phage-related lysozyme (muramidase)
LAIDWNFISQFEGGQRLEGYIPAGHGKSGVTIATGFDIGQRSVVDLERLPIPPSLTARLRPYALLTGAEATTALTRLPLTVMRADADAIDRATECSVYENLRRIYDAALTNDAALPTFDDLPDQAQTVIASVSYQYGELSERTPRFWRHITEQNWLGAIHELENFCDRYPSRRRQEAQRLRTVVSADPAPRV